MLGRGSLVATRSHVDSLPSFPLFFSLHHLSLCVHLQHPQPWNLAAEIHLGSLYILPLARSWQIPATSFPKQQDLSPCLSDVTSCPHTLILGTLLLNTHVSNFQNSKGKDNLSCASSSSVTPLLFPPAEQVSGSLSSQAMTPVSPYYLLHSISKCHLQYLDQLILPQGLPQGLFFPFLSWPATTTHTHWYSCLWLSFTTASTAN